MQSSLSDEDQIAAWLGSHRPRLCPPKFLLPSINSHDETKHIELIEEPKERRGFRRFNTWGQRQHAIRNARCVALYLEWQREGGDVAARRRMSQRYRRSPVTIGDLIRHGRRLVQVDRAA